MVSRFWISDGLHLNAHLASEKAAPVDASAAFSLVDGMTTDAPSNI